LNVQNLDGTDIYFTNDFSGIANIMSIIIVTDIFGVTPALITLSDKLNAKFIVDPYNGINMNFKNEFEAYSYFTEQVGLENYLEKLIKVVDSTSNISSLLGFSVGASVIWRLSEKLLSAKIKNAICYYGSQIRHFTSITPQFPVELIFPKTEEHFDLLKLQQSLSNKPNITIRNTNFYHGFMNFHSSNFNACGYNTHLAWLCSRLDK
jgi:dienelactone hydrolase